MDTPLWMPQSYNDIYSLDVRDKIALEIGAFFMEIFVPILDQKLISSLTLGPQGHSSKSEARLGQPLSPLLPLSCKLRPG